MSIWRFFYGFCALSRYPQVQNSVNFKLKLGLIALFIHLKIILLQCFQFSAINGIQIDPKLNGIRLKGRRSNNISWPCACIWNSCWLWESETYRWVHGEPIHVLDSVWVWVSHNSRGIRGHSNWYDHVCLGQGMLFVFYFSLGFIWLHSVSYDGAWL